MKLYRLLSIVILLLNRERVSAAEFAEYFEVSQRTIYRDIETICQAGIPIIAYQGVNGGFGIMDNYVLDKYLLTPGEISSIVTALKGVTATLEDQHLMDVIEKILALIPDKDKEKLQNQEHIILDFHPWGTSKAERNKVNQLKRAIESIQIASFSYTNAQGINLNRQVEPMVLVLRGYSWYLFGYCLLKNDYRLFKLSRMKNLQIEKTRFQRREKSYDEIPDSWGSRKDISMLLRFHPRARVRVEDYFGTEALHYDEEGYMTIRVTYPEDEWVYSFVLGFGSDVEVLEPQHLRDLLRDRAKQIWDMYRSG